MHSKTTSPSKNLTPNYEAPSNDEMNASSGRQDKDVIVLEHAY